MRIAISGASGLIGSHLATRLTEQGNQILPLVRRQAGTHEISWDPARGTVDGAALDGVDAVIHLGGENIASARWTPAMKERIRESRVQGTHVLATALAGLDTPPKVWIAASAIGYYGSRGSELLDEQSEVGDDFLAQVVSDWEQSTKPATAAGIRVARLRIGVVLSPKGGALAKMLTPFKLGFGGRVGSGQQYWSWITLDDVAGAIGHVLENNNLSGPVNVVAPEAVTNTTFTRILGRVLHRPTFFPMPASVARIALGEMADALLLSSTRVEPKCLLESGYHFQHPTLEPALRYLLRT